MNITQIPTAELRAGLAATVADIRLCEIALRMGVTTYSDERYTQHRLEHNFYIQQIILAELARRKQEEK